MAVSKKRIRELAEHLLAHAGVHTPPVPVEQIARSQGAVVRFQPYEDKISGFVYRHDKRTIIGINAIHHPRRRRFTVAHELGHALLHKHIFAEVHVDRAFRNELSSQGTDPEEREANQFAAELLMPVAFLQKDLAGVDPVDLLDEAFVTKLARRYGVSVQALLFRLANLGYITL